MRRLRFLVLPLLVLLLLTPVLARGELRRLKKKLGQALAKGEPGMAAQVVEKMGAVNTEKAAQEIVGLAANVDKLTRFKGDDPKQEKKFAAAEARNQIFRAAKRALAGMSDEDAIEFMHEEAVDHRDARVRILLIEVLGRRGTPQTEETLIEIIGDRKTARRQASVLSAAIAELAAMRSKKAIPHLIDLVEEHEKAQNHVWVDAGKALISLTGEEMEKADDYRNWWNSVKDSFDPKKVNRKAKAGHGTLSRKKPKFFGTEVLSKAAVFVLDVSGSMKLKDPVPGEPVADKDKLPQERQRLYRSKKAMAKMIQGLDQSVKFNIVTYSSKIKWFKPGYKLVHATPKNRSNAVKFIQGMHPEGFTWTDTAFEEAFKVKDVNTIYFMSDGIPQRAGNKQYIPTDDIIQLIRDLNKYRKVKIETAGFPDADEDFMRQIARENGGKYVEIK